MTTKTMTTSTKKTKTKKKAENKRGLNAVAEHFNKKWGQGTIVRASAVARDPIRLLTNCLAFDLASGGGIPLHATTLFYGPDGGGKSNICLDTVASVLQTCFRCFRPLHLCNCSKSALKKNVLWADVDGTLNREWAESLGVDCERLFVSRCDFGEHYIETARLAVQEDDCGLVVIDDLAALVSLAEMEADMMKQNVAPQARLVSRMNRVMKGHLADQMKRDHPVAIVCTNELRFKVGVMFGNPETQSAGQAIKHGVSLRCRIQKRSLEQALKDRYGDKKRDIVYAHRHRFSFDKWKLFRLRGADEFTRLEENYPDLNLRRGEIDDVNRLRKNAERYKLLVKEKKKWKLIGLGKSDTRKNDLVNNLNWKEKQSLRWMIVQQAKKEFLEQHEKNTKPAL